MRKGKTFHLPSIIQSGSRDDMQLMGQMLQKLINEKKVSVEETARFPRIMGSLLRITSRLEVNNGQSTDYC